MTPAEASDLLTRCAAFDNRQPSATAAIAWASALRNVPLDADAFAAVDRFYGTPPKKPGDRLWIQPHDVTSHRMAIRKERLGETLPAYEPPAEPETGAAFIARRRAQLDAVATGRIVGEPVGQLTGGPHPKVAARLASIGRAVPGEGDDPEVVDIKRPGALGIECPQCHAPIGHACGVQGAAGERRPRKLKKPHAARGRVAMGQPAGLETAAEIEQRRQASLVALQQMAEREASGE